MELSAKGILFLFKKEHVAVIPEIAFGKVFNKYIFLAFTLNVDKIIEGVNRIGNFINGL